MDELDNILKKLIKDKYSAQGFTESENCLSEERFAEYLENVLNPSLKEQVEKHLNECEACFQKSIVFNRMLQKMKNKKPLHVPVNVAEQAKILMRNRYPENMIEVVLEFGETGVHVLRDKADICTIPDQAALSMRSRGDRERKTHVVHVRREFDGLNVNASVEKINDKACEIEVKISDSASKEPLDDIRVSLVSGDKELASYLTVQGRASFKNLGIDTYMLQIIKGKVSVGSLIIKLTSAE